MTQRFPLWIILFGIILGIYVLLPVVAPVFMALGWSGSGKAIYLLYSFLCHQLPERSYFLFGPKLTYSLVEVQAAWQNSADPLILRQFIGNAEMGWKVAWSDRMVSMFLATWVFGLFWWPVRRRLKPLPLWGLILFLLPMVVDGFTHFLSDLAGLGAGFRFSNDWLATITHNAYPAGFYQGDAWGSFNSVMRLVTGLLFGVGVVWFSFPFLNRLFSQDELPETAYSIQARTNVVKATDSKKPH